MSDKAVLLTQKPERVRRKDFRLPALIGVFTVVVLIGLGIQSLPDTTAPPLSLEKTTQHQSFQRFQPQGPEEVEEKVWKTEPLINPQDDPNGHATQAREREADLRFQQAAAMMEAQRFGYALVALNRVLELKPDDPRALTEKGFALQAIGKPAQAFAAFDRALDVDPGHAMAYFGAATALESLGELEAALSGMRSFLHTTDMGPEKLYVAQARSAIWEWEARLGRGPWGPTNGIPPGFTAEEVRRDGKGVAVKMPLPETADEEGRMRYEIKAAEKTEIFER